MSSIVVLFISKLPCAHFLFFFFPRARCSYLLLLIFKLTFVHFLSLPSLRDDDESNERAERNADLEALEEAKRLAEEAAEAAELVRELKILK